MKKKYLYLISCFLIVSLVSCSKKNQSSSTTNKASNTADVSVELLTDASGIDDKSFNASAWRGIERFYNDPSQRNVKYSTVVNQSQDTYVSALRTAADKGVSLIISSGFTWADATYKVAADEPNQKFMLIDASGESRPNVAATLFAEEMGSYLVGVIAAEQAKADGIVNPGFGFVGGVPGATITRFEMGFIQGVRSVIPDAKIIDYYANDWGKPELAKSQAKNWYDTGIYCIFAAAGATGNGVIAQAKEERVKGHNVWAIGVDSDQFEDGLYNDTDSAVLTSMLKKVENATYLVLTEIANDNWKGGERVFDLASDSVGYSDKNPALSKQAIDAAEMARQDIISGKIVVEKTYKGAREKGLVPSNLHALDD